jgi:hypothetical protein
MLNTIAAMTPGIQPQQVRMNTRSMAPHPLSRTARGGKMMQMIALRIPITIKLSVKGR